MDLPSWIHWQNPPRQEQPAAEKPPERPTKREPPVWRAMTDLERRAVKALGLCRLPPASSTKRIVRSLVGQEAAAEPKITDKQAAMLWKFAYTYRRQIDDQAVRCVATKWHVEEERKP